MNTEAGYNKNAEADNWTASLAYSEWKVMNVGGECETLSMVAVNYDDSPDDAPDQELGAKVSHLHYLDTLFYNS
jgi:hypothetical protein